MIKCIVSDLDGTLLNQKHMLGERNAQAVKKAQEAGYTFMVATGRHWGSVQPFLMKYGIKCRCILLNGAVYQDELGNVIKEIPLELTRAKEVIEILERYQINVHLYTKEGTVAAHPERLKKDFIERLKRDEHITQKEVEEILETSNFCKFDIHVENMEEYFANKPIIYKIEAFSNDDAAMQQVREELGNFHDVVISDSIGHNFELTAQRAQKGYMLEEVIQELGFTKEEVIVFGDSMNDLSMMEMFPHSYAMGNSCPLILQSAKHRIGKNSEDAVAQVIERLLSQNQ